MTDFASALPETIENLKRLEALLFAAPGLSSVDQLAQGLNLGKVEVISLLDILTTNYEMNSGLRLQKVKNQYQLVSAPEYGHDIEDFLGLEFTTRLTQAALEALAIIAYKQPATRPEIDAIRGVNSDTVVKEAAGRPIFYGITEEFLHHFGLESIDKLPTVDLEGILRPAVKAVQDALTNDERIGA
jgi:segregation and condensation protein B